MALTLDGYAAELDRGESFDDCLDRLMGIVGDLGYTQVLYAYQRMPPRLPDGEWIPLKLNVRNFPKGWEAGWERFGSFDPYYRACFEGTLPFDWNDVQSRETLHPIERQAWHYLADFGLGRGMTIPLHLPGGRFAVVSAIVDRSRADWLGIRERTYESMFRLTHLFHKSIHDRGLEAQVPCAMSVRLSPREIECLRWSAGGRTAQDVANILDRSVETVRLHLKNAINKLGANNRTQAVAKATQLGLLHPE
ncbi:MAG: LuxR family transcriptional regulator [Alphaproteobacteria bacterium]